MFTVKGTFRNGVAQPEQPVEPVREGQRVVITFLEEDTPEASDHEDPWDQLVRLIDECAMNTGIGDLAEQHDHYLYGKPKRK